MLWMHSFFIYSTVQMFWAGVKKRCKVGMLSKIYIYIFINLQNAK